MFNLSRDPSQPRYSGLKNSTVVGDDQRDDCNKENSNQNHFGSSASSASEQISEINEFDAADEMNTPTEGLKRNASIMTEATYCKESHLRVNPFHQEMKEYFE